jgi:hypothetical protein
MACESVVEIGYLYEGRIVACRRWWEVIGRRDVTKPFQQIPMACGGEGQVPTSDLSGSLLVGRISFKQVGKWFIIEHIIHQCQIPMNAS